MSRTDRHKRKNRPRKRRRRWWHRVTCKDVFLYGPLALFLLAAGIGPFIYEFWYHRDLLYGLILLTVVVIYIVIMAQEEILNPRRQSDET